MQWILEQVKERGIIKSSIQNKMEQSNNKLQGWRLRYFKEYSKMESMTNGQDSGNKQGLQGRCLECEVVDLCI